MHDRGVVHGQIKTSNILLTKEGICKHSDLRIDTIEKQMEQMNLTAIPMICEIHIPPESYKTSG